MRRVLSLRAGRWTVKPLPLEEQRLLLDLLLVEEPRCIQMGFCRRLLPVCCFDQRANRFLTSTIPRDSTPRRNGFRWMR